MKAGASSAYMGMTGNRVCSVITARPPRKVPLHSRPSSGLNDNEAARKVVHIGKIPDKLGLGHFCRGGTPS